MNKRKFFAGCLFAVMTAIPAFAQEKMLFRDENTPIEKRVKDLLSRLTVEEKVGRLPLTYYKNLKELPAFDDYDMTKGRTYQYFKGECLYPFGYGLSYTTFAYSDMNVKEQGDGYDVTFKVKNTGSMAGDEVSQLYIKTPEAGGPIKQLKGFSRTHFKKGEEKTVTIKVGKDALRHWDVAAGKFVIPDGNYQFMVGASSADIHLQQTVKR